MWNKLYLATFIYCFFLVAAVGTIAFSQENQKPDYILMKVPCAPTANMYEIMKTWKQGLLFSGNGTVSSQKDKTFTGAMQTFVNQETGSYAIVLSWGGGMSCLVLPGNSFTPYSGMQPWDNKESEL